MAQGDQYRVVMRLHSDSNLPADDAVNVWHFREKTVAGGADIPNILDMVEDFYTVVPTGDTRDVFEGLSVTLSGNYTLQVYDMQQPSPRVPIATRTGSDAPGAASLPRDVAICMSFQGDQTPGVAQARRRGRVFLGPLSSGVLASLTGLVEASWATTIRRAGRSLIAASDSSLTMEWIVRSSFSPFYAVITNGWVDNAFDTQRRRDEGPTTRGTFDNNDPA